MGCVEVTYARRRHGEQASVQSLLLAWSEPAPRAADAVGIRARSPFPAMVRLTSWSWRFSVLVDGLPTEHFSRCQRPR